MLHDHYSLQKLKNFSFFAAEKNEIDLKNNDGNNRTE